MHNTDTIVAMATPSGGAIGMLRLSGPEAISIVSRIFQMVSSKGNLLEKQGYTLHYGTLHALNGEEIDDVMVSVYHTPHSYTGEDCIEITCHGSAYIMQKALHACIDAGARQANPGEYTQRAYLNGKMDLSQAEAVADLISASNKATHQLALSQLKGHFSNELSLLREQLLKITSLLELELDFSDHEELEFADRSELKELAETIDKRITTLAHSFETGNALKNGIPVAIIGKTNVGKSTLLNQLLHEEKAIVSDIDGTTRDVIEDTMIIHGATFRIIDTAGIRATQDKIEQIGIERAYQKLNEAQIVLWLLDSVPSVEEMTDIAHHVQDKKVIVLRNKIDLGHHDSPIPYSSLDFQPYAELPISSKQGIGIHDLEETIYASADIPEINENSIGVTNARHYEALTRAHDSLSRVITGLSLNLSGDLLAEDLRICLEQLAEITGGQITPNEVLGNIFKHFCIGK
ncbi:MAG: tRNA uridine-5-carboxymethylaminomethyl(34) synthesis GTPase MnmE [Prevotella sp.]|nr:tRNA uridine-5-carboxymethylaminomethyl(34) synthesis GTPase MnmE [Prevotella sp.]